MPISFSVKAAALECGLSERTLHAAIAKRELKVMRVGRRILIAPSALENFVMGKPARTGEEVLRD
jgi:excisionase family DNA binding protein